MFSKSFLVMSFFISLMSANAFGGAHGGAEQPEKQLGGCTSYLKVYPISERYDLHLHGETLSVPALNASHVTTVRVYSDGRVVFDLSGPQGSTKMRYELTHLLEILSAYVSHADPTVMGLHMLTADIRAHRPVKLDDVIGFAGHEEVTNYQIINSAQWRDGVLIDDLGQSHSNAEAVRAKLDHLASHLEKVSRGAKDMYQFLLFNEVVIDNINRGLSHVSQKNKPLSEPAARQQE